MAATTRFGLVVALDLGNTRLATKITRSCLVSRRSTKLYGAPELTLNYPNIVNARKNTDLRYKAPR